MKYLLLLFFFVFISNGFANEKDVLVLDVELNLDGRLVAQPNVISFSGETAKIESVSKDGNGICIEVTPTLQNTNQVHMTFVLVKIEQEKKSIISSPQIISLLGQPAEIKIESQDQSDMSLSLTVTPSLKK